MPRPRPNGMSRAAAAGGNLLFMGCLIALLALISPRLVIFLMWIFGDMLGHAYDSWIVPFLGFFLLPWTTVSYALFYEWGRGNHVTGFEYFFVILAFFLDLASFFGGRRAQTMRAA